MLELSPWSMMGSTGRPTKGLPPSAESLLEKRAASKRVAIVEDELIVAWTIETMLEDLGHQVVGVYSTGEEAVSALSHGEVDIVCLDINLGTGIDGVETAQRIRSAQAVALIFVSAYSDEATMQRVSQVAPDAVLLGKPVEAGAMSVAIAQVGGTFSVN